ncbi:MAG: trehalase family glycosidase [Acutalibacteraceae bacterium]|nr:trehalase family glycosidase [Acutalibacteraceae bacterium]
MTDKFGLFYNWGPFSKKYAGISRIEQHNYVDGARFDFSVAPAIHAFDIKVPNVTLPSAYHPWLCNKDYSFYSYRHDLEWKDKVFADVSYVKLSDESFLVRTEIVNNTDIIKDCVVNYFSSIEYPADTYVKLSLPEKCDYTDALSYDTYNYAIVRPWDEQNADGFKKGEFLDKRFVSGKGLGDRAGKWHMPYKVLKPFGGEKGDTVSYKINVNNNYKNAVLALRYRTSDIFYEQGKQVGVHYINSKNTAEFVLNGKTTVVLPPSDELRTTYIHIGALEKGELKLTLVSNGTGAAEFDFLCLCENWDKEKISVEKHTVNFTPIYNDEKCESGYISTLKYDGIDGEYRLRVFDDNTRFRQIETGALEDCMTARLSNADETFDDVTESFTGAFNRKHSDEGFFHNAISHTIFIEKGESKVLYAVISKEETKYKSEAEYEKLYNEAKATAIDIKVNPSGEKYKLSNQILAATLMTNVVYPIYKHGEYIIHHTPGKRWDCLYTWDSGFIGLGMNEIAPDFAEYILDTYLSEEDNKDYAFLHHGSPVPVQIYQLYEMLQKAEDKSHILKYYSRARLYYLYLAGKIRNSTTAKFKSGILTTYDYFYSTSGMDDYPAQVAMMKQNLRDKASPVITTGQVIRFGKILSILADKLGKKADKEEYKADIEKLTNALNKYSWDEESGYYSYVLHNENFEPVGKFLTKDGENLNKGLDGIYPIIAGVCDENQTEKIIDHITNEDEMHTPFGISAVDKSASYYMVNGYWNGNIWFPHQWFIFKSMLDLGRADIAKDIAHLALNIWKREVESTYYTFEMVNTVTGLGGWFHNFGGLSTPLIMWLKAYYTPGTVNVGFDTYLEKTVFNNDKTDAEITFTCYGENKKFNLLCVMKEGKDYTATVDGKEFPFCYENGHISFEFDFAKGTTHTIKIQEIK